MVAYNFKSRWADDVAQKRKRCTIRPRRKRPTRPGDLLQLYTGMRTKNCRKLVSSDPTCKSVRPIIIHTAGVSLSGKLLSPRELDRLVKDDGFENVVAFFEFFEKTYGYPVRDDLELIEW